MSGFKDPNYLERRSAANDARKAALERFRAGNAASVAPGEASAKEVPAEPADRKTASTIPTGETPGSKGRKRKAPSK